MTSGEIYERLRQLVEEKIEVSDLSPESDLAALGLDSLDRADIMMRIEEEFGFEFSESEMVSVATLSDLLATIQTKIGG